MTSPRLGQTGCQLASRIPAALRCGAALLLRCQPSPHRRSNTVKGPTHRAPPASPRCGAAPPLCQGGDGLRGVVLLARGSCGTAPCVHPLCSHCFGRQGAAFALCSHCLCAVFPLPCAVFPLPLRCVPTAFALCSHCLCGHRLCTAFHRPFHCLCGQRCCICFVCSAAFVSKTPPSVVFQPASRLRHCLCLVSQLQSFAPGLMRSSGT